MYDYEHRTKNSGNVKTFSKLSNFKFQDIKKQAPYSELPNNCAAYPILFWKFCFLLALIRTYTIIWQVRVSIQVNIWIIYLHMQWQKNICNKIKICQRTSISAQGSLIIYRYIIYPNK